MDTVSADTLSADTHSADTHSADTHSAGTGSTDPVLALAQDLDARILRAHKQLRRAERDLALLLAEMADSRRFLDLGYANLCDYAEARLELEPRKARDLVRIGRALPELPCMDQAMTAGTLCWTKARDVLAVVTPETEAQWVEVASRLNSRELERKVAAHAPGERPTDDQVKESGPVRRVFTMEPVEAEQVDTALAAIRAAAGVSRHELGDGALLAQMAGRVLASMETSEAPTGERFRIVIEHCPRCGLTTAPEAEVSETHVGQAQCDAAVLDMREGPQRGHVSRTIPPATRRAVLQRDHHRCQVPGCSNRLWLDLHHLTHFAGGGENSEGNLLTLCNIHHQVLHDGRLGIERQKEGLVFRFGDGRVVHAPHVGHGAGLAVPVTHVGHGAGRVVPVPRMGHGAGPGVLPGGAAAAEAETRPEAGVLV